MYTDQRKTNVNTGICLNGFYSDGIGKGNISYGYWKDISSSASGRRKDEAWENIDLNEVIADEGIGKECDVRAAAAAFG